MKRLLLLLILFPIVLFGQTRQKAIVDSIKAAATDIQSISAAINKYPGNKVEQIRVTDSGEYVTVVVRVHVTDASLIPPLQLQPILKMRTNAVEPGNMTMLVVPTPSLPFFEPETILAVPLQLALMLPTARPPIVKMDTIEVPIIPDIKPDIEALPILTLVRFSVGEIAPVKADTITVSSLPDFDPGAIETLTPFAVVEFAIARPPAWKVDAIAISGLEMGDTSVATMHLSAEGYDLLEKLEGFSPKLYSLKDGGFTIGFGFFVPYGEGSKWAKGVTQEEAERMMRQKVPAYEDQVKQYINVPLTQEEFDALTMLAYNLGGFSKATSIVRDINTNVDFEQLQKDWMRFVHSKAPAVMKGLMNRRKDELQVRYESNYQPERKIQVLINKR